MECENSFVGDREEEKLQSPQCEPSFVTHSIRLSTHRLGRDEHVPGYQRAQSVQHEREEDQSVAILWRIQLHLHAVHCHALHVQLVIRQVVLLPGGCQSDGLVAAAVAVQEAVLLVRVSVGRTLSVTICRTDKVSLAKLCILIGEQ